MKKIGITTGDPAGIGPEIVSKTLKFRAKDFIYIIYGKNYRNRLNVQKITDIEKANDPNIIYHINIDSAVRIGELSQKAGEIAYAILKRCAHDLILGKLDAVVTAPVSKAAIEISHPTFIGHTEFFAQESKLSNDDIIMSFWSDTFNLVLLTTHHSVIDAIKLLTYQFMFKKLKKIYQETKKIIPNPKIAMMAINPHAGENGKFGKEDEILKAVLFDLSKEDINIDGPFPSDSFFAKRYTSYDIIVSALHDQGLIPFKMINYGKGTNVTLGLPFVRTSPDHGTAFDIAGRGIANESSMEEALDFAEFLLTKNRVANKAYSAFASYYDSYMEHVDYNQWVKLILAKYNDFTSSKLEKIYELACGTANVSSLLVSMGYSVYGSDNSEYMLKIADKKKDKPILFNRDFLKPINIIDNDLVLLIFDSINYIDNSSDIVKLFNNVYDSLKTDGIFIFDISTIKNCTENFDGFVNLEDNDESYFIHESFFDTDKLKSKLIFFKKNGYLYRRIDEEHRQYIYPIKEIIENISESRLTLKGCFSMDYPSDNLLEISMQPDEMDHDYERIFFVLKKEK